LTKDGGANDGETGVKFSSWIGLEVSEGTDTMDVAANVGADLKFGAPQHAFQESEAVDRMRL